MNVTVFFLLTTLVPPREQYICHLQWVKRDLCRYYCQNERKTFLWFEKQSEKGCEKTRKFYKT